MAPLIPIPPTLPPFLEPYLPTQQEKPFVTLTYAQSLDSRIAIKPGVQTVISHLETKTMTHYLRSKHDAILVGIGTVLADDPGLNCRYNDHKIIPVILDPSFKFCTKIKNSRLIKTLISGEGAAPIIIIADNVQIAQEDYDYYHNEIGLKFIRLPSEYGLIPWKLIFQALSCLEINSIMVEGGAKVINDLLAYRENGQSCINSLIITIGPIFLGLNGVQVSPLDKINLQKVTWWTGSQDSVLASQISYKQIL